MYVHQEAKLIYLAHPRTASNSTAAALMTVGFEKVVPGDHHSRLSEAGPLMGLIDPVDRYEARSQWATFTTVRNHWDTVVSWMFAKYGGDDPLTVWNLERFCLVLGERFPFARSGPRRFTRQNPWVGDSTLWSRHGNDADITIRFERLAFGLTAVLNAHGVSVPEALPHLMKSDARDGRPYQDFYTPQTRSYVADRFGAEIERYGYTFLEV